MRKMLFALAALALAALASPALAQTAPKPTRVPGSYTACTVVSPVVIDCPSGPRVITTRPGGYDSFRFDEGVFKPIGGKLVEVDIITGQPVVSALPPATDANAIYNRGWNDALAWIASATVSGKR